MENSHNTRYSLRAGAVILFLCASIFGSVHATELAGHPQPAGVTVSVDENTGRNQVTIEVGADILAVNSMRISANDQPPRYRLATDALGDTPTDAAIELWPESRKRDEASAGHTAVVFSFGFTLATSGREVVLFDLGRCATAGDAAVWLPKERTLITGRVASVDRVEATNGTDLASWIEALERLQGLGPSVVIPGFGVPGGPEILTNQIDHLNEIRKEVEEGLLAGRSPATIAGGSTLGWLTAWNEQDSRAANAAVEALVAEVGGLRMPWELAERRWLREGKSPTRRTRTGHRHAGCCGATTGRSACLCSPWWRQASRSYRSPTMRKRYNSWKMLTRSLARPHRSCSRPGESSAGFRSVRPASNATWQFQSSVAARCCSRMARSSPRLKSPSTSWRSPGPSPGASVIRSQRRTERPGYGPRSATWHRCYGCAEKTLLVVGLGGIGTEVARLASAAEMRVTGIRSSRRSGPPFVDRVGLTEDLAAFAAEADVVVNCLPMTPDTADIFDETLFHVMKETAFFVNVGRGGTVDTDALIAALSNGDIAGAGLDVTDPEPLPDGHPLWNAPNLIITPHYAAWSDIGRERRWLLYRENLRRFVAGEPMLSVVDPERGY